MPRRNRQGIHNPKKRVEIAQIENSLINDEPDRPWTSQLQDDGIDPREMIRQQQKTALRQPSHTMRADAIHATGQNLANEAQEATGEWSFGDGLGHGREGDLRVPARKSQRLFGRNPRFRSVLTGESLQPIFRELLAGPPNELCLMQPSRGCQILARGGQLTLLLAINLFNYIDRYVLAAVEPRDSKRLSARGRRNGHGQDGSAFNRVFSSATWCWRSRVWIPG